MNYFENIEGLIEQTDENIENIEKRTEKRLLITSSKNR